MENNISELQVKYRQYNHDMRNALSPIALILGSLQNHPDAAVQKNAMIIEKTLLRIEILMTNISK